MCETHFCNWLYFKAPCVSNIPQAKENVHYVLRLAIVPHYQPVSLLTHFFSKISVHKLAHMHKTLSSKNEFRKESSTGE